MKFFVSKNYRLCSFFALAVTFGIARPVRSENSEKSILGTPAGELSITGQHTEQEIQRWLITAASGRGWEVVSKDDEKVIVTLEHHRWHAKVVMNFSSERVIFFSDSLRDGKPAVPEDYIKNLKEDILEHLKPGQH